MFNLNSSRDLAFLYLVCRFAQRNDARCVTVSVPYVLVGQNLFELALHNQTYLTVLTAKKGLTFTRYLPLIERVSKYLSIF